MERIREIGHILDQRLTTEVLAQVYPSEKQQEEKSLSPSEIKSRHDQVCYDLLVKAGSILAEELGSPEIKGREAIFVCRRVEQFLLARGFSVKITC